MSTTSEAISCRNLSVGYASGKLRKFVLEGINATFRKGDVAAIAGINGAGKSTLLKTLTGLLKPLQGEIYLFGKEITAFSPHELSRTISLVLTERPEELYLTVFDTVASGRSPYTGFWGKLSRTDHLVVQRSLQYVGVGHLKHRLLNSVSDGERHKVMIAKALAQDTPIIMLDEPAAFLDFPSKIELMHLLKRLASEHHKTILFSSHDLDLIIRTADNVWLIGNNAPIVQGVPEILLKTHAFAQSFGNDRLKFDPLLGHFQVQETVKGTYLILDDMENNALIASALQRKGFMPSNTSEADLIIKFAGTNYQLLNNSETTTFENFEKLIYGIQKL